MAPCVARRKGALSMADGGWSVFVAACAPMDRRTLIAALAALPLPLYARPAPPGVAQLAALEHRAGGRLGIMVRDCASGAGFGWRSEERFAHNSSFKLSLAAMVLAEIDAGRARGDVVLPYSVLDVLPASPITGAAHGGMAVIDLAAAAVKFSDNLAANLLLARFGGPAALTRFWRALGDPVSRLDHNEPELNHGAREDLADTTTPAAMAATLGAMLTGPVLTPASRAVLWGWMKQCETGLGRLRAGLRPGWQAGDKTGSGWGAGHVARINDLALALAPVGDGHFRAPLAVAAYYEPAGEHESLAPAEEAVLGQAMAIVTDPAMWKGVTR